MYSLQSGLHLICIWFIIGTECWATLANPVLSDGSDVGSMSGSSSAALVAPPATLDFGARKPFANVDESSVSSNPSTHSSYRWALLPADDLFNSLKNRILMVRPVMRYPFTRKRSCFINAGLSNNCDFKDLISAANARRIWESQTSPGKKRSIKLDLLAESVPRTRLSASPPPPPPQPSLLLPVQIYDSHQTTGPNNLDEVDSNRNGLPVLNSISSIRHLSSPSESLSPSSSSSSSLSQLSPASVSVIAKRMECLSGLPGGDCENTFLGGESLGQDFLRPGGRNPGKR